MTLRAWTHLRMSQGRRGILESLDLRKKAQSQKKLAQTWQKRTLSQKMMQQKWMKRQNQLKRLVLVTWRQQRRLTAKISLT